MSLKYLLIEYVVEEHQSEFSNEFTIFSVSRESFRPIAISIFNY